ncbi:MAG: CapA family protein [bacterium]
MANRSEKIIFFLNALIALQAILLTAFLFYFQPWQFLENKPQQAKVSESLLKEPSGENQIEIILAGDIMLDRGVKYMVEKEGEGDFRFPFLKIADYLKEADILFGNLEGPVSDKGIDVGSIYSFRMNPKATEGLAFAGFNVLSLANNHVFDYTREALKDTFQRLKTANIDYVGAGFNEKEAYSAVIKEIKGTKIAFLAFTNLGPESWQATENNSGIAWLDGSGFEKLKNAVWEAQKTADIIIVSLHAGQEYSTQLTQFQKEFAKIAVEAGADLIVGHHPHVIQPNEIYQGKHIFYSLGNFVFDQGFSEETMRGQIVKVLIENKRIEKAEPIDIRINNYFQPEIKE